MAILALDLIPSLDSILNVLYVALGIGLVIFFHELGHFAVAKWCDVAVERFSIGFGPVLWRFKRGETEYALSAIPFGGYVKMLGQDDIDPSQLSSDEIAEDPRSYTAKSVWARMAIISAGVIMNVITGTLFYAGAFGLGIHVPRPVVGYVEVGSPAWESGIARGDQITRINGEEINNFNDIVLAVALADSNRFLFSTPAVDTAALDDGRIPASLRAAFEQASQNIPLPDQVTVVTDSAGDRWKFQGTGQQTLFELRRRDDQLEISGGVLKINGLRGDRKLTWNVIPDSSRGLRKIGIGSTKGLKLAKSHKGGPGPAWPGTPAAAATPPLAGGDDIRRVGNTTIDEYADLQLIMARQSNQPLELYIERTPEDATSELIQVTVPPQKVRTLGLSIDIERITSVRAESPAAEAGLHVGDKLLTVNGREIGMQLNPLELPNLFAELHGQNVKVTVLREQESGPPGKIDVTLVPEDHPGWLNLPLAENSPVAVPAIGIAFYTTDHVRSVVPGSPAERAGIKVGDQLLKMIVPAPKDIEESEARVLSFEENKRDWPRAFWLLQLPGTDSVDLRIVSETGSTRTVTLSPWHDPDLNWFLPERGFRLYTLTEPRKANGVGEALSMAFEHAVTTLKRIRLTLGSLFAGDVPIAELNGPLRIVKVAYEVAEQGLPSLLLFLGFLSLNLAVINFLPIPVLDGGHMVFLCWEAVTRRRPNERVLVVATYCGLAFVLLLMVTVLFLDVQYFTK